VVNVAIDPESGLPVVPHEFADPNARCDVCLIIEERGDRADLVCNECDAVVKTVPAQQAEAALTELSWSTGEVTSATCPHCGAVHVSPGFSELLGFVCEACGKGVGVNRTGQ
jgi:hypothetical protein